MFRILFVSFFKPEYRELSLCSHAYELYSPLLYPYKAESDDRVKLP